MKQDFSYTNSYKAKNCLETDWKAVRHNLQYFRSLLQSETKLLIMLKSDAYGNGDWELALKMQAETLIDYVAVFHVEEGILLRKKGVTLPIMVMDHRSSELKLYDQYQLEVVIYRIDQLKAFSKYNQQHNDSLKGHLKFNTGMNRLGIDTYKIEKVIDTLRRSASLPIASVITHLSSTKLATEDAFTRQQIELFEHTLNKLKQHLPENVMSHVLNSHGILRFPEYHYDMVRLGIGAYGGSDHEDLIDILKPISRLKTEVCDIRRLEKNASISYDRSGRLKKASCIASIPLGYDDGLPRKLGNGKWKVEINGKLYPIIGNICMNLSMIDMGDDQAKIGDTVIIFGGLKSIFDYANAVDTITYEAMTNIGSKVERILVNT